jgi:hypothetical protein
MAEIRQNLTIVKLGQMIETFPEEGRSLDFANVASKEKL